MVECIDHLEFTNGICPDCGLEVDGYGNTESQPFDYCCFPDCGCDGSRLCQAGEANENASEMNVESMYQRTDGEAVEARLKTVGLCLDKSKGR